MSSPLTSRANHHYCIYMYPHHLKKSNRRWYAEKPIRFILWNIVLKINMVGKEVENVVERKEIKLRIMPQYYQETFLREWVQPISHSNWYAPSLECIQDKMNHSIQSVSAGAADNSFGNRTGPASSTGWPATRPSSGLVQIQNLLINR